MRMRERWIIRIRKGGWSRFFLLGSGSFCMPCRIMVEVVDIEKIACCIE
jgi:hypothetical protein